MTTIKLKNGSGAPLAGDLVQGEPALDLTNKRLYTEDSGGTVIEVGTNPTSLTTGTFTSTGIDDNAASTAMTLDASGNVLVGTTSTIPFLSNSATGAGITSTGTVMAGATAEAGLFNRIGSDGSIASFYKAGALVGSIGTIGGFTLIGSGDTGVLFDATEDAIKPRNTSTASRDAAIDLGGSGDRFKDLYLSGKTYLNTSSGAQLVLQTDATRAFVGTSTNHPLLFESNGTERMRIDASGNLLVGKTYTAAGIEGQELRAGGYTAFTRSGGNPLELNRLTSDGTIINFSKDGSTVGSIGTVAGDMFVGTSSTGVRFLDANNEIIPITVSSGGGSTDGTISLGGSPYRFKDLYLSGGVYLGGTGSANKLDDYEEGTWTPVVRGSTTSGSYTYSLGYAMYTKIGRQVTLTFYLSNITQVSAGTGYLQIIGVPFTKPSSQYVRGPVSLQNINWFNSNTYGGLEFTSAAGSDTLYVRLNGDNYGGSDLQINELVSGSSDIGGTITFFA